MDKFNEAQRAKETADMTLDNIRETAVQIRGGKKIETALAAVQSLYHAIQKVHDPDASPVAAIKQARAAMHTAAVALPVAEILYAEKLVADGFSIDAGRYGLDDFYQWPQVAMELSDELAATVRLMIFAADAMYVWCGIDELPQDVFVPPVEDASTAAANMQAMRDLYGNLEEICAEIGKDVSKAVAIGILNSDGRERSHRSKRDNRNERAARCQAIADELWMEDPHAFNSDVAALVATKYREKYPKEIRENGTSLSAATINDWFKDGILISRRRKLSEKRSS